MIKKRKLRLAMQSAATALTFALATVGSVGATTTIGTNISTDGTLTVAGASTLQAAASITSTTNPQLTVKYSAASYMTQGVSTTGVVTFTRYGSALQKGFTLADTVAIATSSLQTLLTVDSTNSSNASTTLAVYTNGTGNAAIFMGGSVGVASSTPWGLLSVEQSTETYSLVVGNSGSSTPSLVVSGVNGNGRVGIATSSPSAMFSIGDASLGTTGGSSATSTIDLGLPCFRVSSYNAKGTREYYYMWPSTDNTTGGWATSTNTCFGPHPASGG